MERSDRPRPRQSEGPTPATRRWVAWRKAVQRAAAEDRLTRDRQRAEDDAEAARDYHDPLAIWVGLAVVLLLAAGGWFLVDAMQCNPLFSNSGLVGSRDCR